MARLAPTVAVGDVVAPGVAASEREAMGVEIYLSRVTKAPVRANKTLRVGTGRNGWNVKKDEFYLTVLWFNETTANVFEAI